MSTDVRNAVVVGLERSDQGRAAVEYAVELATRRHLPLRLARAYESQYLNRSGFGWTISVDEAVRNSAHRLIDETVEVLSIVAPQLPVSVRLEPGSAVEMLLDESAQAHAVVLGSRGSGGFADLLVGSTTLHVASRARCPVIALPAPVEGEAPRHGFVVGVEGSELSEAAIEFAMNAASEESEPLVALHAWTDPAQLGTGAMLPLVYDPELVNDEERLVLAESMAGWSEKYPDVKVEHKVVRDHPIHALIEEAAHARLLIVGSRGRGPVSSLLGSVSHGVLHHATAPVAVVHERP